LYNAHQEIFLKSTQFKTGASGYYQTEDGGKYIACTKWGNDWAYAQTDKRGSIKRNGNTTKTLKAGQKLSVLGFPLGIGGGDRSQQNMTPMFSTCTVAHDKGLQGGVIEVSENGTDQGNSGGPVFANNNGKIEVVGLVSYGMGSRGKLGGMCSVSQF
jgi:V8-like Glu-specific endopeptidase